jgi:hypothetical protein
MCYEPRLSPRVSFPTFGALRKTPNELFISGEIVPGQNQLVNNILTKKVILLSKYMLYILCFIE